MISSRHTDAVYGIDRASGHILWKLGGTSTPESLRVVGDPANRLLGGPHDARVGSDGRLTIYDNGKGRPRLPRVVSYRLDLRRRTATYLGQLNDPEVTDSHCCGSARELPGGGWLVSWGTTRSSPDSIAPARSLFASIWPRRASGRCRLHPER